MLPSPILFFFVLQDSLAAHLPVTDKPLEVASFLDRVQRLIEARWRVALPPAAPLQVPSTAHRSVPVLPHAAPMPFQPKLDDQQMQLPPQPPQQLQDQHFTGMLHA